MTGSSVSGAGEAGTGVAHYADSTSPLLPLVVSIACSCLAAAGLSRASCCLPLTRWPWWSSVSLVMHEGLSRSVY